MTSNPPTRPARVAPLKPGRLGSAFPEARCLVQPGQVWRNATGTYRPGGRYGPRVAVVTDVTLVAGPYGRRAHFRNVATGGCTSSLLNPRGDRVKGYTLVEDPNQYRAALADATSGRLLHFEPWQETFAAASARLADVLATFEAPVFGRVAALIQRKPADD